MHEDQQGYPLGDAITSTDSEKLLATQEEMEFMHEQIESLKLVLEDTEQQLQDIEEELKYTNQELCDVVKSNYFTLGQAKELAKEILLSEQPIGESLAQLISGIYSVDVQPRELAPKNSPSRSQLSHLKMTQLEQFSPEPAKLQTLAVELQPRFASTKTHCAQLRVQLNDFRN